MREAQLYVDLNRYFVERKTYDSHELVVAEFGGRRVSWADVLANRFSVIVAPANAGKTTEMKEQAARMRADGAPALFVALREVSRQGGLETALAPADREALRRWKESRKTPLTVFADSLDEVSPGKPSQVVSGVRQLAHALGWPDSPVRWVISTRPAMLTVDVMTQLTSELIDLAAQASVQTTVSATEIPGETIGRPVSSPTTADSDQLRLYNLALLDSKQAKKYLVSKYPAVESEALLRVVRTCGLHGYTTSPGGLDVLANIDLVARTPESLTEVLERVVDTVSRLHNRDPRLESLESTAGARIAEAAQKLAAASQICQLPNIEFPQTRLGVTDGILSAREIATPLLSEPVLSQLLSSQLFIDSGYHQVKFYPDAVVPFLAAERLANLVQTPEQARKLVEGLSWRSPTSEQGVYRQLLPLLGWLAVLNTHCREEILVRDPQAVAFFSDLRNASIPLDVATEALRKSIERMVYQGDWPGRGYFELTSENYWQAGGTRVEPLLRELFIRYRNHDGARTALLNIAKYSRTDVLRHCVLEKHGNDYVRLIQQGDEVEYLLELGIDADLASLAKALVEDEGVSEGRAARLMARLGWRYLTGRNLAELIHRKFERGVLQFHISYMLKESLLDDADDRQLYAFGRALVVRVARGRRGRTPNPLVYHRYIELVAETLAVLVARTSLAAQNVARLCLLVQQVHMDAGIGSSDLSDLRKALETHTPVRRALLSGIVKHCGNDARSLWECTLGDGRICSFTAADVAAASAAHLTSLFKEHDEAQAADRARPQRASTSTTERYTISNEDRQKLRARLDELRAGAATGDLARIAKWLASTTAGSSFGEVNIDVLAHVAGPEVTAAVRQGLSRLWRTQQPVYDKDNPRTTDAGTVAGLQGLHLELDYGAGVPQLTDDEVRNALRYGFFELNRYPKWFWPLVRAREHVAGQELYEKVTRASDDVVSLEHVERLLRSLGEAPAGVQVKLAPLAWRFIQEHSGLEDHALGELLGVVTQLAGAAPRREFEHDARKKINAAFSRLIRDDEELAAAQRSERSQGVLWAAHWLACYPASFRSALEKWRKRPRWDHSAFVFELAAHFGERGGPTIVELAKRSDDGVEALGSVYEWVIEWIREEDDNDHGNDDSFNSTARDHAEHFRDALIPAIAAGRSQRAYEVLARLSRLVTGRRLAYLQRKQFEMREEQAAWSPLPQRKYEDFERDFAAHVTDTLSLARAVHSDLLAVKYDIERGDYSLRALFSEVNFQRIRSNKDGLALEVHFQRLLASELNHLSKGRYSVLVEPQTAEANRRDICCAKGDTFVSIELKMSMRWSFEQYVEALEKQLVAQYMRHRRATTGFLVVVLQKIGQKWRDPTSGGMVNFQGLLEALQKRALELESRDRNRYIRVIGIDATAPKRFREVRKTSSRKSGKSGISDSGPKPTKTVAATQRDSKKRPRKPATANRARSGRVRI